MRSPSVKILLVFLALMAAVGLRAEGYWLVWRVSRTTSWVEAPDLKITDQQCSRLGKNSTRKLDCTITYAPVGGTGEQKTYSFVRADETRIARRMLRSRQDPSFVAPDLALDDVPVQLKSVRFAITTYALVFLAFGVFVMLRYRREFAEVWAALRPAPPPAPTAHPSPPSSPPAPKPPMPRAPTVVRSRGPVFGRRTG